MQQDIYKLIEQEVAARRPFAVATVIAVRGSASAKPGSKALIAADGRNLFGWVGGGCADAFVRGQAVEAIVAGQPRIVQADLDDEVFGLGMPCGGVMDVFIDPQAPAPKLQLPVPEALLGVAMDMTRRLGLSLEAEASGLTSLPELMATMAQQVARLRGKSGASLAAPTTATAAGRSPQQPTALILCGASRITEELARLGVLLKWPVTVYASLPEAPAAFPEGIVWRRPGAGFRDVEIPHGAAVVVAAHHKGDPEYMERALRAGALYVGLVASRKRSLLVRDALLALPGVNGRVDRGAAEILRAPAGLDIGCPMPADIALSIVAEILAMTVLADRGESHEQPHRP